MNCEKQIQSFALEFIERILALFSVPYAGSVHFPNANRGYGKLDHGLNEINDVINKFYPCSIVDVNEQVCLMILINNDQPSVVVPMVRTKSRERPFRYGFAYGKWVIYNRVPLHTPVQVIIRNFVTREVKDEHSECILTGWDKDKLTYTGWFRSRTGFYYNNAITNCDGCLMAPISSFSRCFYEEDLFSEDSPLYKESFASASVETWAERLMPSTFDFNEIQQQGTK
jgi:hypothetical protein